VTIATAEAPALAVDAARPWPGLDAFTEELSRFFCGRDTEADELLRRMRRDLVTLLFGQSGLGKTSLLQAGLFPRLRQTGFLPILVRLDYSAGALPPAAQVKAALERALASAALPEATPIGAEDSLWGYLHRADRRLADRAGKEIIPVLVFDQFEEIFTQGLVGSDSRAASQGFLNELAELAENRPPEVLKVAMEADLEIVQRFRFDRQDYRFVLALREDFLAALEALRSRAPSLGRNRYRLLPMNGRQGLDAILKPARGLVQPEVAREIIRFIGRASPEDAFGIAAGGEAVEGLEVEPALLSLLCAELNDRRIVRGLNQIDADLLAGSRDEIITGFYERCLADQPAALRAFVEDKLLSDSGFRESVTLDSARRILSDEGVPADAIDELVRRRLLRIEERLDLARVEIIHDVLTPVIRKSRDTRRLRQAETVAAEREAAWRRERRRVRRAHWLTAAMAVLALVTVALAWWGWSSKVEAERQRVLAEERRAAVAAESKRAEQNFDIAVTTADTIVTDVAERLRNLTGVSAATIREILVSAERAFDQITAAAANSQHLRWRRAVMLVSFAATYQTLGDSGEALRRARAGSDIMVALGKENPANDQWKLDLAKSLRAIGDALCSGRGACEGDLPGALAEYGDDLEIMTRLTMKDPENSEWQDELGSAHLGIGNVLRAQGDVAGALAEYRTDVDVTQRLAEKDPGNAKWQRDLSIGHVRVGDVLSGRGDPAALAEYRAYFDIAERLAEKDPGNTQWQRDLSVGHNKVGDVLRDQGDLAAALAEYRAGLNIARRLADKDPGNVLWHRDLSFSRSKVGDVLRDRGDLAAALAEYRAGLDIIQPLAEKDPGNTQWQHDVLAAYTKIGLAASSRNDFSAALDAFEEAEKIALHVKEISPTAATSTTDLAWVQKRLEETRRKIAGSAAAGNRKR
jgi:tetratricopeptide (TPR) repeat protein